MPDTLDNVVAYWNSRADMGQLAGTNDILAKQLEMSVLDKAVPYSGRILDAGCGNGMTLAYLAAKRPKCEFVGIDNAEAMIAKAREVSAASNITYKVDSVLNHGDTYDVVYTERTLINLPTWEAQKQAIEHLADIGTTYLMMENSADGLEQINRLRRTVGLPPVVPPWHNRYMQDAELDTVECALMMVQDYSAMYYFVSRVLTAALAQAEGKEPDYLSPLNRLAARLAPGCLGTYIMGQGRLWKWQRGGTPITLKADTTWTSNMRNGGGFSAWMRTPAGAYT
jgi:SAM-dependent methyltransferase